MKGYDGPYRYVKKPVLSLLRPAFRYSESRRAYVLRVFGGRMGPMLRADRRRHATEFSGPDRRGVLSEDEAYSRVW